MAQVINWVILTILQTLPIWHTLQLFWPEGEEWNLYALSKDT